MRGLIASLLSIAIAFGAGCDQKQTAQREPDVPNGGVSMYPLSAPVAAPPMQGFVGQPAPADNYAAAAVRPPPAPSPYTTTVAGYGGGQYCEVVDMTEASTVVPIVDPPIMVDNTLYASTGSAPVTPPQLPPMTYTSPEPTYTPTVNSRPSPYAGLTTTTTYSAPTYTTTTATYTQPYYAPEVSPAYTSTTSGQYCEVTDTSESSYVIPIADPPIVVGAPVGSATYYSPTSSMPVATVTTTTYQPLASSAPYDPMTPVQGIYVPSYNSTTTTQYNPPAPAISGSSYGPTGTMAIYSPAVGQMRLVPALDIPPGSRPSDYGPSQWFEIVRPGNGPVRIGRVSATCVCVGVRVPNRHVAAGQRALIEVRTVSRPPQRNAAYGVYVQVLEPSSVMLDADVTPSMRR